MTPQVRPSWRSEFSFVDADRFETSTRPTAVGFGGLDGGHGIVVPGTWGRTPAVPGASCSGCIIPPAVPVAFTACSLPLFETMRMTFRGAPGALVAARPAVRTGPRRFTTVAPPLPRRLPRGRLPVPRGTATSEFAWAGVATADGDVCCCAVRLTMTTFLRTDELSACAEAAAAGLVPSRCFTPPLVLAGGCGCSEELPAALDAMLFPGGWLVA